ncbi:MAG: AraC family transcriptional regulator [bacterium]
MRSRVPTTTASLVPLLIYRDIVDATAQTVLNHHHDFCSLYLVRRGSGIHVIDGVEFAVARGDVYVMGVGMPHYFHSGDHLETDTIHFSPTIFDRETLEILIGTPGFHSLYIGDDVLEKDPESARVSAERSEARRWLHLTPAAYAQIEGEMTELRTEYLRGNSESALLIRSLFVRLLVHLSRFYTEYAAREKRHAEVNGHERTVAAAVRFMEEKFASPLRIEQVAAHVYLSPDRFTEVFAAAMGRTPRDYLRHLRLERAKTLLTGSQVPISEVARLSGFGEAPYFTRALRAATGLTPRAYRNQKS